jgi:hypothetical protein
MTRICTWTWRDLNKDLVSLYLLHVVRSLGRCCKRSESNLDASGVDFAVKTNSTARPCSSKRLFWYVSLLFHAVHTSARCPLDQHIAFANAVAVI